MDIVFTVGSFLICFWLCQKRPALGIGFALSAGCFYGIIRANYPGLIGYFFFDATLLATYAGCWRNREFRDRPTPPAVTKWLIPLLIWPVMLIWVGDSFLASVVGLRTAIFFPLCVLLGLRLTSDDLAVVARFVAVTLIIVTFFAWLESTLGLELYYPRNDVTEIIYNSNDVVVADQRYYRIPATFANAASYAGTMVIFIPLMVHGLDRDRGYFKLLMAIGLICCVLGVFISSTRIAAVSLGFTALYVLLRNPGMIFNLRTGTIFFGVVLVAYSFIENNPRFQRFKTLGEDNLVVNRVAVSNHLSLIDLAIGYPLGGGLAVTGVSLPRFIKSSSKAFPSENEYARIIGTQGIPGLILTLGFLLTCVLAGLKRSERMSHIASDATTGVLLITMISGFVGVGAFAGIPSAAALFVILGYQGTASQESEEEVDLETTVV